MKTWRWLLACHAVYAVLHLPVHVLTVLLVLQIEIDRLRLKLHKRKVLADECTGLYNACLEGMALRRK